MVETALIDPTKASPRVLRHLARESDKDRLSSLLRGILDNKPIVAISGIVAVEYLNKQRLLVTPAAVAAQMALLAWLAGEAAAAIAGALTPWPFD